MDTAADLYSSDNNNSQNPLVPKGEESSEIVADESPSIQQHWKHTLIVKIPTATNEGSYKDSVTINMPPSPLRTPKRVIFSPFPSPSHASPSSSKGKSPVKALIPKVSFKFRNNNAEIEKEILALRESQEMQEKRTISRTFSLSKIFAPKMKRTSSLPASPVMRSNPESTHGGISHIAVDVDRGGSQVAMHRSRSVPVLNDDGSGKQMDQLGSVFRVTATTPQVTEHTRGTETTSGTIDTVENINQSEDIPEDEAVCRICFVELGEGSDSLKMECSCKGELALAHKECAIKWFTIKGNKTCDVCKQDVKNLPVTLLKIQNTRSRETHPAEAVRYRVWQDVPVLVIVSMLAYFCFLEQLLVNNMGSSAIAISLPFSCILGLLASMTSTTMVRRRYAWLYATVQFALVVLFAHVFYSLLHVQAVLSVLLAAFAGFGGAMCGTSFLMELIKLRRTWSTTSSNSPVQETSHVDQGEPGNQGTEHVS